MEQSDHHRRRRLGFFAAPGQPRRQPGAAANRQCDASGTLASDARIGSWAIGRKTNADLQFLDGGQFNAWGLGGALMLDYERFSATQDIDAELRYSYSASAKFRQ
ncbi:hypothetical protein LNQ52_24650 [Klebsiella pneumoniae subsp. pneumoniae]|nr:hypothetical protein [Klebsiella pneumoniae subsp. pneumoniae]